MVRQPGITAAIVITLGLTTSLAPSASADPPPLARAEAAITATQYPGGGTIRPNPDEQTVTGPAVAPALASSPAPCGEVCSGYGYGFVNPQPTIVRVTSGGGFDWGDAGIGAGACVVLLGIGLASARIVTKGRRQRPAEQRTIATS